MALPVFTIPASVPYDPQGFAGFLTTLVQAINNWAIAFSQATSSTTVVVPTSTVAKLPPAAATNKGNLAYVTDGAPGILWGNAVSGGGSTLYLVWSNGANWTVVGK